MASGMDPKAFLRLAPERRQMFNLALRQAVEMLQMPQMELSQWLYQEIEKNPLLELHSSISKGSRVEELACPVNLHEHLQNQIRDHFSQKEDRWIAEQFLLCLDERGFIPEGPQTFPDDLLDRIPNVLSVLQTFDPPGIFARNLREALLLQLRAKGKQGLAFKVVEQCFEDLLHGRYKVIEKKLGAIELKEAIRELASLSLRPASIFRQDPAVTIQPDFTVEQIDGGWTLELREDELPKFHIRTEYLTLELESEEEKEALRGFKTQAKWIFRSLERRRQLLISLSRFLVKRQSSFLEQKGPLRPVSVKELAEKLSVHESTISRALAGKYIATPRGTLALHELVYSPPAATEILQQLVQMEDKSRPLTDEELASALKEKGFSVARRTIAKYRTQLKISSAARRKHS